MLTQDNVDLFLDHIPLDELPRTFRDAIYASRRLGIDFIWIDALCIIQGEVHSSDWANEAGHMSDIYGGTFLNLAASTATSVHEGFFQRKKYHNGGFIARVTTSDYCRQQNFHSRMAYEESTTDSYLATRAWAFQEKLLSPRTIYFGDTGLFWECRSHMGSEFLPDGFPGLHGGQVVIPEDMPWDWWHIVRHYSKAKLTYSSDRLPALSGIAARQRQLTGGQYLAGMWRESLITQLPWQLVGKKRRRPEWRAPTWSWASVDGAATYWGYWRHKNLKLNECIQVLEVWTRPSGPDPYGAVTDGQLMVSCNHLILGHIDTVGIVNEEVDDLVHVEAGSRPFPVKMDCLEEASTQIDGKVHLLPVIEGESGASRETDGIRTRQLMIQGLVLRASDSSKHPQQFHRIGSFHLCSRMNNREEEDIYKAFIDVLGKTGSSMAATDLAQIVSDSEDRNRRHVLIIK
ncbi:hypothetical protein diail_11917 [Diaporthe ilicicola]|nr:hypothetical protein diail_11917 [Diaporthe ilicicola]